VTYQRQMTDEFIDKELTEIKKGLTSFRQSRVKHTNQLEHIRKEAVNKYHSIDKKACQVYAKFKTAGFSDFAADSMYRQAHKYNINPNLDLQQILNAVKAKHSQLTNNQQSNEPGNIGVHDKAYPESSYGSDVPSCIDSLTKIGVDESRARVECETQYAGKGYRGGKTMNASVSPNEVPYFVTVSGGDTSHLIDTSVSRIKSAKEEKDDAMYNYIITQQMGNHKDSVNYVPPNIEFEEMIYQKGERLRQAAETKRLKSGKKEPDPYEGKPAWYIVSGQGL
jgi:hypothetical protein